MHEHSSTEPLWGVLRVVLNLDFHPTRLHQTDEDSVRCAEEAGRGGGWTCSNRDRRGTGRSGASSAFASPFVSMGRRISSPAVNDRALDSSITSFFVAEPGSSVLLPVRSVGQITIIQTFTPLAGATRNGALADLLLSASGC